MSEMNTEAPEDALDFRMTDIEEKLAGAEGAATKRDLVATLQERGANVKARMDAGLAPDEYQKAELAYQALAAAHEIIANFPVNED